MIHPSIFREPAPGLNRQFAGGLVYSEVNPPAVARRGWEVEDSSSSA